MLLRSIRAVQHKDQQPVFRSVNLHILLCSFTCISAHWVCFATIFLLMCTVVHQSLFSSKQRSPAKHQKTAATQQAVVRQRLEQAELCGFKPIDSPTAAAASVSSRRQTAGRGSHKVGSESSSNPLSGDEYYWTHSDDLRCRLWSVDLLQIRLV